MTCFVRNKCDPCSSRPPDSSHICMYVCMYVYIYIFCGRLQHSTNKCKAVQGSYADLSTLPKRKHCCFKSTSVAARLGAELPYWVLSRWKRVGCQRYFASNGFESHQDADDPRKINTSSSGNTTALVQYQLHRLEPSGPAF